jgi:hypothetical protein
LARKARGKVTAGMRRALTDMALWSRLNFMSPSAVSLSSSSWSMKSWYSQWERLTSEGLLRWKGMVSRLRSIIGK